MFTFKYSICLAAIGAAIRWISLFPSQLSIQFHSLAQFALGKIFPLHPRPPYLKGEWGPKPKEKVPHNFLGRLQKRINFLNFHFLP